MANRMRLQLFGSNKKPFYRLVVTESRNKRDGKFLENLGTYDPLRNLINFKLDKVEKWLSQGVQPTQTVKSLLKKHKNQFKSI